MLLILVIIMVEGLYGPEVHSAAGHCLSCAPPNAPPHMLLQGHTLDGLVACSYRICMTLTSQGWEQTLSIYQSVNRGYHHSSWMSPDGLILMGGEGIGGESRNGEAMEAGKTTTKLLADKTTTPSFELQYYTA